MYVYTHISNVKITSASFSISLYECMCLSVCLSPVLHALDVYYKVPKCVSI